MNAMRLKVLCLALACLAALPAVAAPEQRPRADARPVRPSTLDDLFARLSASGDATEAKGVAALIERRFARSGSDTADLLMGRAGEALTSQDAALAVELLDRVTQLRPGWAEAWSRRAAAFVLLEDPVDAAADLRRAVTEEPRHWGAWAALGQMALGAGDNRRALEAFRRALAIYPMLDDVRAKVDRLAPDIDGRDL